MRRPVLPFCCIVAAIAFSLCLWTEEKPDNGEKKDDMPPPAVPEALKKLEDQYYFAPRAGLKDLEVQLSGEGFAELKARAPAFAAVFYWKAPDKTRVKITGVPDKTGINVPLLEERLAKELGDAIVKRPFSDQPEKFEAFREEKVEENTVVTMIPKDKTQALLQTTYVIAPDGVLKGISVVVRSRTGEVEVYEGKTTTTEMKDKLLTTETLLTCGKDKLLCARYEYTEVSGFILPSKFVQTTVSGSRRKTFELVLTDYKVNQGLADSIFLEAAEDRE